MPINTPAAFAAAAPLSARGGVASAPLPAARPAAAPRAARAAPRVSATAGPASALSATATQYEQLEALTTIVEDTGDIKEIERHRPLNATTNPSLIYKAAALPEYADIVEEAIAYGREKGGGDAAAVLAAARNCLFTKFGKRILDVVPGDVSTEVDARLSFDVEGQVETARELIRMYEEMGVAKERVLIKMATTWEGVCACRILEAEGIRCNMTLLFSLAQAVAAADAGAFLISPFVGRVMDWYKKAEGVDGYEAAADPGVLAVREIYNYYKCHGVETVVMGASFRNLGEILELAGCDRLTIAPAFIDQLKASKVEVRHALLNPVPAECVVEEVPMDEKAFRWAMNQDAMATEKLHEGIRGFAADLEKLDDKLRKMIG